MKWRRHAVRFALVGLLLIADTALGHHAVNVNAAGVLLSPGGAVTMDALLTALGFLGARVGWVVLLTSSAALVAADAAKHIGGMR